MDLKKGCPFCGIKMVAGEKSKCYYHPDKIGDKFCPGNEITIDADDPEEVSAWENRLEHDDVKVMPEPPPEFEWTCDMMGQKKRLVPCPCCHGWGAHQNLLPVGKQVWVCKTCGGARMVMEVVHYEKVRRND